MADHRPPTRDHHQRFLRVRRRRNRVVVMGMEMGMETGMDIVVRIPICVKPRIATVIGTGTGTFCSATRTRRADSINCNISTSRIRIHLRIITKPPITITTRYPGTPTACARLSWSIHARALMPGPERTQRARPRRRRRTVAASGTSTRLRRVVLLQSAPVPQPRSPHSARIVAGRPPTCSHTMRHQDQAPG